MMVEDVKRLAESFKKDMVVVLVWDRETATTNILTYGTDKMLANEAHATGARIAEALGLKDMVLLEDRRYEHKL